MRELRQSTAVDVIFGPFLDETNGKDAETGLTITQAEVRITKNAANTIPKAEATSLVHDELGHYVCKLNGTDTGTLGQLRVMVHESGALPVWEDFAIVTANYWDSKYSTDKLQVHVVEYTAGVINSAAFDATIAVNFTGSLSGSVGSVSGAVGSVSGAVGSVTGAVGSVTGAVGSVTAGVTLGADAVSAAALKADAVTEIQSGLATAAALTTHDTALDSASGDVSSILNYVGSAGVEIAAVAIAEIRSGLARATALTIHDNALAAIEDTINTINGNVNSILTDTGSAGVVIADGHLTAAKFGADFLTAAKIADDAFSAEHFNTSCLTSDAFAASITVNIVGTITGNLIGDVTGNVDGNVGGSVATLTGKTGFKLASDGLDLINVDTLAAEAVSLPKAMELCLSLLGGVASYNSGTGVWTIKGRDGVSTLWTITLTDEGDRSGSVIA